jgi:hypothetical protein
MGMRLRACSSQVVRVAHTSHSAFHQCLADEGRALWHCIVPHMRYVQASCYTVDGHTAAACWYWRVAYQLVEAAAGGSQWSHVSRMLLGCMEHSLKLIVIQALQAGRPLRTWAGRCHGMGGDLAASAHQHHAWSPQSTQACPVAHTAEHQAWPQAAAVQHQT